MLSMMPGMSSQLKGAEIDDSVMNRPKAIILSMTPEEREHPDIINPSRKRRIAKGAGVDISEVNRMIKQFEQMKKMMKQMGLTGSKGGSKKRRRRSGGMGGMLGMGGMPGMGGKFPF
jgi:signal recognition particle subunit SRP54